MARRIQDAGDHRRLFDVEGAPDYVKIRVVDGVDGATVVETAKAMVETGSVIRTDGLCSYKVLEKENYEHHSEVFDPENRPEHLRWLHVIVSNLKAFITGTYHGLDKKHLQRYFKRILLSFQSTSFQQPAF